MAAMDEPIMKKKTLMPDWSKLPEELLDVISKKLDNCFDVVHARSVCTSWRSAFPFPASLLRPSYSLPTFPIEKVGLCSLEKIPLFLFRVRAHAADSDFFLGQVSRNDSVERLPLQCSVKVKLRRTMMNMFDCQIFSLGNRYEMICWSPEGLKTVYRHVAFLPLNKEGREEFAVLLIYDKTLLLLTSAERRWIEIKNVPSCPCLSLVTFRGRFYATFLNKDIFVIDPYSLEATSVMPSTFLMTNNYIVPSGNDELFLVEKSTPSARQFVFRVSRLDETAGRWVGITDLGDRVLFIGHLGNLSCSAKELPDGCGVSGNSILFTKTSILFTKTQPGNVSFFYKYDDITNCWRLSEENGVTIQRTSSFLALRVKC